MNADQPPERPWRLFLPGRWSRRKRKAERARIQAHRWSVWYLENYRFYLKRHLDRVWGDVMGAPTWAEAGFAASAGPSIDDNP